MYRLLLFVTFTISISPLGIFSQTLEDKLEELSRKYHFTYAELNTDTLFSEKYLLWFEQPVDHDEAGHGTIRQRVFLSHIDRSSPVVFITEGYDAYYAANASHVSELAAIYKANQVCVEHRYFGSSLPEPFSWEYLTVANAAADHHRIIEVLKNIYTGSWISTGISKGGQTAMYHRYFYPDDVDITVPYVAPLNFSIEDRRVYRFLNTVGTEECRERIYQFQAELLKHKDKYLPAFRKMAEQKQLTYPVDIGQAYELIVFEYSFAFWQWGQYSCGKIPVKFNDEEDIVQHLDDIAGIDWISDQGIDKLRPFFYQAMREIGFYGFDIEPFRQWTSFTANPTFEFTLPDGVEVEYEPELMQEVDHFIRHRAQNMLFIYGEHDPWSAPAVELTYHTNSEKVVKPGGSHITRIINLPQEQKTFVIEQIRSWLDASQPATSR